MNFRVAAEDVRKTIKVVTGQLSWTQCLSSQSINLSGKDEALMTLEVLARVSPLLPYHANEDPYYLKLITSLTELYNLLDSTERERELSKSPSSDIIMVSQDLKCEEL